jgi:hypothetical protein
MQTKQSPNLPGDCFAELAMTHAVAFFVHRSTIYEDALE